VDSSDARRKEAARAESIEQAVPGYRGQVLFPIDLDSFFCHEEAISGTMDPAEGAGGGGVSRGKDSKLDGAVRIPVRIP